MSLFNQKSRLERKLRQQIAQDFDNHVKRCFSVVPQSEIAMMNAMVVQSAVSKVYDVLIDRDDLYESYGKQGISYYSILEEEHQKAIDRHLKKYID